MVDAKKQSIQHQIDAEGELLLRSKLPKSWKLREYKPDYGLDFALEVFEDFPVDASPYATSQTLGEHMFIQLKSTSAPKAATLNIYGRKNVEKSHEKLDRKSFEGQMQTYRFGLETPELVTVDRMGIAVPVLLVVADLHNSRCSFVCLNDYIDKILIPRFDDFRTAKSRTIHVPLENEIGTETGNAGLSWYAKRAKLVAAFQRFVFQDNELQYANGIDEIRTLADHFASRIAQYDFWTNTPMWPIIGNMSDALQRYISSGQPNILNTRTPEGVEADYDGWLIEQDILTLWKQLASLPGMYEDICREFLLPTGLGLNSSY
ncbi:MAG: DUF4365 domain-containing protein [Parasphingorhabdus sp.]